MGFNKETRPEKRETHPYEQRPKKNDRATQQALGKLAVQNTLKDKPKK